MNLRPRKQLVPAPRGADADAQAAKLGSAFAAPLRLAHDGRPGAFAPRAAPARCGPSCAVGCPLPRGAEAGALEAPTFEGKMPRIDAVTDVDVSTGTGNGPRLVVGSGDAVVLVELRCLG